MPNNEQSLADARELIIAGLLTLEGYVVSRPLSGASRYDLIAERGGKLFKIQVKSLKRDLEYKHLSYPVYKVEAYSFNPVTKSKNGYTPEEVDVVVGYNHEDRCFAAVPLRSFEGKLSGVIHSQSSSDRSPSLRNEYFNCWKALD